MKYQNEEQNGWLVVVRDIQILKSEKKMLKVKRLLV